MAKKRSIAPRFWPSKPLASLGRIWNRYLLTMLTWNRGDSTPLSAAPRVPKCDRQQLWKALITGDTVTRLSIPIQGRGKSPEEGQRWNLAETLWKKKQHSIYQDEDKNSAINKKINSQIKKTHLEMIPIKRQESCWRCTRPYIRKIT